MTISASFSGLTDLNGLTDIPQGGITVVTSAGGTSRAGQVFFGWMFYFTQAT